MPDQQIAVSIIVPVYRSATCLPKLVDQLTRTLEPRGEEYEIILVDDASEDGTWATIQELAKAIPRLSAVRMMRNYGQHQAIVYGMSLARGDVVVTMDDDLQNPPDQVPLLLDALAEHPDVDCVFGCAKEKHHSWYRNWGSDLMRRLHARNFDLPRDLCSSSFRAMRSSVANALAECDTRNPALAVMIYQVTTQAMSIPVHHEPRAIGKSHYTFYRQARMALDYICGTSLLPLHMVAGVGITLCLISMVYVAVTIYRYLRQDIELVGWTSTIVMIAFSSGVILLALAIIGEYLVRILREVQGTPACRERERVGQIARADKDH